MADVHVPGSASPLSGQVVLCCGEGHEAFHLEEGGGSVCLSVCRSAEKCVEQAS